MPAAETSSTTGQSVSPQVHFADAHDAVTRASTAIFERWTALTLTVEHQLGGDPRTTRQMLQRTIDFVMSSNPRRDFDALVDFFYDEFERMHTDVEDGSLEQVARSIIRIRDAAIRADFSPADALVSASSSNSPQGVDPVSHAFGINPGPNDSGPGPGADIHMRDSPPEPVMDDDGFTTVTRRGRHR